MFSKRTKLLLCLLILAGLLWYSPLLLSLIKPKVGRAIQTQTILAADEISQINNNTLYYPNLLIQTPFTVNAETSPLNTQDWNAIRQALKKGVSVAFNEKSFVDAPLVFISGHSSDTYPHPYASVFSGLNESKPADLIYLKIDNQVYTYKMTEKKILTPTDETAFETLRPADSKKQRIVLVTCWPLLTTKNRLVVIADSIE